MKFLLGRRAAHEAGVVLVVEVAAVAGDVGGAGLAEDVPHVAAGLAGGAPDDGVAQHPLHLRRGHQVLPNLLTARCQVAGDRLAGDRLAAARQLHQQVADALDLDIAGPDPFAWAYRSYI